MIDERIAEQLARGLRGLEALSRIPKRARQLALGAVSLVVGVAFDLLVRLDAMLDAPKAGSDRCSERDIGIDVRCGDPILDALRLLRPRYDSQSAGAVLLAPRRIRRRRLVGCAKRITHFDGGFEHAGASFGMQALELHVHRAASVEQLVVEFGMNC